MYSGAILQKVLTKDLESNYAKDGISPGAFTVSLGEYSGNDPKIVEKVEDIANRQLSTAYKLPVEEKVRQFTCKSIRLMREGDQDFNEKRVFPSLASITGYDDKIKILNGSIPKGVAENGVYETAVSSEALGRLQLLLGNVYSVAGINNNEENPQEIIKIKISCIFTVENKNDLFWSGNRYDNLKTSLVFDSEVLADLAQRFEEIKIENVENTYYLDYRAIKIEDIERLSNTYEGQLRWRAKNGNIADIKLPAIEVLESYKQREKELGITLWILTIPLMIIICFYTLMMSALIIKNDKNEIALLKSRGAGRIQIFLLYVLESTVISGISFALGPFLGYLICSLLGSSNGFLEFVSRKALPLTIDADAYLYSFIAAAVFLVFMLVPALKASSKSIVQYKRSLTQDNEKPLWKKLYLDVLVLGLSIYGLYSFNNRQNVLNLTGVKGSDLGVDPLLFFMSTFFIVGVSLVFLRIYPLLMRLIFIAGVKWWNPVLYFSLVNVSRADRNQQSIMLFIILALSFGIINSNQARTINSNITDRIMYNNGADIVIEPYNNLKHMQRGFIAGSSSSYKEDYREPPYEEYMKIEGIESMTKVFSYDNSFIKSGVANVRDVKVMGITPHEFAKTTCYRSDLMSHHINEYMNLLTGAQKAAILSTGLRDEYGLKKGDNIFIQWGNDNIIECTVYEFIDYFPSCNPYDGEKDGEKNTKKKEFAVINYSYILNKLPRQPYEIWIKKQKNTPDGVINDELIKRALTVERVDYSMQEIIEKKMTLCF